MQALSGPLGNLKRSRALSNKRAKEFLRQVCSEDIWQPRLLTDPDKPCGKEWGENRAGNTGRTSDKDNQRWSQVKWRGGKWRHGGEKQQHCSQRRGCLRKRRKTRGGEECFQHLVMVQNVCLSLTEYCWVCIFYIFLTFSLNALSPV